MFKKLIAKVTLSPSAIGDLSNYYKELKKHTIYRIVAVLLFSFVLILEYAIINISPPTGTPNERTPSDMIVTKNTTNIKYSLEARNISQGNANATTNPAQSADQLVFTLNAHNVSKEPQTVDFAIDLQDVFDYASLLGNNEAALYDTVLKWPETTIEPGENQSRTFTIKMARDISTAPMNQLAYDCKMTTAFGSIQNSVVRCSTVKYLETELSALPKFSNTLSLTIIIVALITSIILLLRNLQLRYEVRIIKNKLTEGDL